MEGTLSRENPSTSDSDDFRREAYEERAAIMEHDGGLTREEAEAEARRLTLFKD